MVPLKITIKDFRSFGGPEEIVFPETPVLSITGDNGAGKSSIIEAIFWALFGQHRQGNGNDCIRTGARSSTVELEFQVSENIYKVIRTIAKTQKTKIMVRENGSFIPAIQSDKVTDVNNFIKKILGASYNELLVASVFMQGDSSRFSRLKPSERQKVLTQLLGIGILEDIRMKAVSNANVIHSKVEQIQWRIDELKKALSTSTDPSHNIEEISLKIEQIKEKMDFYEAKIRELISQKTELVSKIEYIKELSEQHNEICNRLEEIGREKEQILARKFELLEFLNNKDKIEREYCEYLEVVEKEKELFVKLNKKRRLESELASYKEIFQKKLNEREKTLSELRNRTTALESEYAIANSESMKVSEYRSQISELAVLKTAYEKLAKDEARTNEIFIQIEKLKAKIAEREREIRQKYAEVKNKIFELGDVEIELERINREMEDVKKNIGKIRESIERGEILRKEIAEIRTQNSVKEQEIAHINKMICQLDEKIQLLQSTDEPRCPLCKSNLTDEHRQKILDDFSNEKKKLLLEKMDITKQLENNAERERILCMDLEEIEKQNIALEKLNSKLVELTKLYTETNSRLKLKNEFMRKEEEYSTQFEKKLYATSDLAQISSLESKIMEIGFSRSALNDIRAKIEKLVVAESLYQSALKSKERAEELQKEILAQRQKIAEIESSPVSPEVKDKIDELTRILSQYESVEKEYFSLKARGDELSSASQSYMNLNLSKQEVENIERQIGKIESEEKKILNRKMKIEEELNESHKIEKKLNFIESELLGEKKGFEENKHYYETLQKQLYDFQIIKARRDDWLRELAELEADCKNTMENEKLLRIVADVCGPAGAQNWFMTQRLGAIEADANEILNNIAPGICVKLKPEEGEKVSVDIITDEVVRDYESLSGGETFRVDFALRLAISRIIANRAGFPLRTLIIDEGFGTQDRDGIDALVKSLIAIQDEFDRIIIVTHVESLADAFPFRFNVRRENGFSKVKLIV